MNSNMPVNFQINPPLRQVDITNPDYANAWGCFEAYLALGKVPVVDKHKFLSMVVIFFATISERQRQRIPNFHLFLETNECKKVYGNDHLPLWFICPVMMFNFVSCD
jgi:hypothetical protein